MPIRARIARNPRSSRGSSVPSNSIAPPSSISSPLVQRSSVDLPEPDGPIRHTTSPAWTDSVTPFSTCSAPNRLTTSR